MLQSVLATWARQAFILDDHVDTNTPVRRLTCPEVYDGDLQSTVEAAHILAGMGVVQMHQLRMKIEERRLANRPRFACPLCFRSLSLRGGPFALEDGEPRGVALHFAHPREPQHHCPYKTGGDFTPEQYGAMKYNGHKETREHRLMKIWLRAGLRRDPGADPTTLHVERRYRSQLPDTAWRQPDVQVVWRAMPLVFEAQLATTFVTVIAHRRAFYKRNGAHLIWVFAHSPDRALRFTEKDVAFNNNCNVFVVNSETAARSERLGKLVLQAWWPDAEARAVNPDQLQWCSEMVTLEQLTFDEVTQTVYYVDHQGEFEEALKLRGLPPPLQRHSKGDFEVPPGTSGLLKLEARPDLGDLAPHDTRSSHLENSAALCEQLMRAVSEVGSVAPPGAVKVVRAFQRRGLVNTLPAMDEHDRMRHFSAGLAALFSARLGRVVGTRYDNLREVENWMWMHHRDYYLPFINGVAQWGRSSDLRTSDPSSTCSLHLREMRANRWSDGQADVRYLQDTSLYPILRAAFPELREALGRIEATQSRSVESLRRRAD